MPPSVEDYEVSNARDWDTDLSITGSRPTSQTVGRFLSPTHYPLRHSENSNITFPVAGLRSSHRFPPLLTLSRPLPQDSQSYQRYHDDRKGHAFQSTTMPIAPPPRHQLFESKWPKMPLVTTALKGIQDKNRKAADDVNKYTRTLPEGISLNFLGYCLWPPTLGDPSDILGGRLELLNGIRGSFHVYITYNKSKSSLQINTDDRDSIDEVLASIRSVIQNSRAENRTATSLYVVPPSESRILFVVPVLRQSLQVRQDQVVKGFKLLPDCSSGADAPTWEYFKADMRQQNLSKHFELIKAQMKDLKDLKTWMRMRIHFGKVELTRYHKSFLDGRYTYEKFSNMMQDFRTAGNFEKSLGTISDAAKVVAAVNEARGLFEPEDPLLSCSADIMPRHSLVVFVKTPASETVRLETDLDMVSTCPGGGIYQWGETLYYPISRHKMHLDVTSCSLDKKHSWRHEIISNNVLRDIPTALKNLIVRNGVSSRLAHCTDTFGFTYPILNISVPPGVLIEAVVIRSSLRYLVKGTNYAFEVAMYRSWNSPQLKSTPATSHFGASFYGTGWGAEMTQPGSIEGGRNWDIELGNFFSSDGKEGLDGFSGCVATIEKIQKFLDPF